MTGVDQQAHDAQTYVPTYSKTPAETATIETDAVKAAQKEYARSYRSSARQFATRVGQTDPFVPVLASLSPSTKVAGAAAFTLTANGSNFNEYSQINWAGQYRPTNYVSPTQLKTDIPATLVQSAATVPVKVYTDSTVSATVNFTITATGRDAVPDEKWKKHDVLDWLLANQEGHTESGLNNLTKSELLEIVARTTD